MERFVDADEPLFGCAEDDGHSVAFGVRVLVVIVAHVEKGSEFLQSINEYGIAFGIVDAFKFAGFIGEHAFGIDRAKHGESVFLSGEKVFATVAGGGVHDSGSVFGSDVIGKEGGGLTVEDWVLELGEFNFRALELFNYLVSCNVALFKCLFKQVF